MREYREGSGAPRSPQTIQEAKLAIKDALDLVQHAYDTGTLTNKQRKRCIEIITSRNPG